MTVSDKATVTGNDGVVPTGTVTFTLWTNNSCTVAATGAPGSTFANPSGAFAL